MFSLQNKNDAYVHTKQGFNSWHDAFFRTIQNSLKYIFLNYHNFLASKILSFDYSSYIKIKIISFLLWIDIKNRFDLQSMRPNRNTTNFNLRPIWNTSKGLFELVRTRIRYTFLQQKKICKRVPDWTHGLY